MFLPYVLPLFCQIFTLQFLWKNGILLWAEKDICTQQFPFFAENDLKPRNLTEVNCMDSCDSTGRSTKCGVTYREAQDAAIGASDSNPLVAGFQIEMSREHRKGTACPSQRCMVGPRQELSWAVFFLLPKLGNSIRRREDTHSPDDKK